MSQDKSEALKAPPEKIKLLPESHYAIAYLTIHGWKPDDIAKEIKYNANTVRDILKKEEVKKYIIKARHKLYGEDPAQRIKEIVPKAIDVAEEIMLKKSTKPHVKADIAFRFIERHMGKPTQQVDLGEGTVRTLLKLLNTQNGLDSQPQNLKNDIEDAFYKELDQDLAESSDGPKEEPKEADKVDDWISKNIK